MTKKFTGPVLLVGNAPDCEDLEYACGFRAPDPVVYFRSGKRSALVVSSLEFGRAQRETVSCEVFTPHMLGVRGKKSRSLGYWAVKLLQNQGVRSVTVPAFFPHGVARILDKEGIRVRVAKGPLFPGRAVKNPDEIRKMRSSQRAAVIAMRRGIEQISATEIDPGGYLKSGRKRITSEQIQEEIAMTLYGHGCLARETIVAGGVQASDPHEKGHGPLKAGEAIVIDIFPQDLETGYWGDITRTVVKGKPTPQVKRMYQAVKAAQAAALHVIKPGISLKRPHREAADLLKRRKFETGLNEGRPVGFFHGLGHGVGLAIHEQPSLTAMAEGRLRSGHVVTVEPGLYYPDVGGVRIEDTIEVTSSGWRYLASCEKRFEV